MKIFHTPNANMINKTKKKKNHNLKKTQIHRSKKKQMFTKGPEMVLSHTPNSERRLNSSTTVLVLPRELMELTGFTSRQDLSMHAVASLRRMIDRQLNNAYSELTNDEDINIQNTIFDKSFKTQDAAMNTANTVRVAIEKHFEEIDSDITFNNNNNEDDSVLRDLLLMFPLLRRSSISCVCKLNVLLYLVLCKNGPIVPVINVSAVKYGNEQLSLIENTSKILWALYNHTSFEYVNDVSVLVQEITNEIENE